MAHFILYLCIGIAVIYLIMHIPLPSMQEVEQDTGRVVRDAERSVSDTARELFDF